ncbi:urease accessory protein UreF [Roseibium sp.]|uniref:urease accessory protein UreF n=1 Tax=Roseibium sp. TaxID=1936156 RepID=UPI003BADA18E
MITGMITIMATGTAMTEQISPAALYRLMTFLSPAFPVGAFTYSHGLEQVIEQGVVTDRVELERWLQDVLRHGAGRTDAILLAETCRKFLANDKDGVQDLRELGLALQPSRERRLETAAQGTAFIRTVQKSWRPQGVGSAAHFHELVDADQDDWPYPVAVGLVCAAHGIPAGTAVTSFLQAFAANLVSAAIRAVPLGQNDGQLVVANLEAVIFGVSEEALRSGLDDLGSSAFLADIASMAHETQYSRLFRS